MEKIHVVLGDLKQKIRVNIHGELSQDGLLTQKVEDYMNCLEVDYRGLEDLLQRDSIYWEQNLQSMKGEALKIHQEF